MYCFLFIPATKSAYYESAAKLLPALRGVVLDLEDSVSPRAKQRARDEIRLRSPAIFEQSPEKLWIRVNGPRSVFFRQDLQLLDDLISNDIYPSIMLPKYERLEELSELQLRLVDNRQKIFVNIETFTGIAAVSSIIQPNHRIHAAAVGAEDLSASLAIRRPTCFYDNPLFLYAAAHIATTCHASGVEYWGNIWPFVTDDSNRSNWLREIDNDIALGANGKIAYHPSQIGEINECFSHGRDAPDELREKLTLLDDTAQRDGSLIAIFNGKMIDAPEIQRAKRHLTTDQDLNELSQRLLKNE